MGQIATMLTSVQRTRSPLQQELDKLTKVLGIIAWTAVAIIVLVGLARGLSGQDVLLLGTAMSNTQLEAQLGGQPADVQDEIVRINTDARPRALQVPLLVPILAASSGSSTRSA